MPRCGERWFGCGGVCMPAGLIGVLWCVMCEEQEEAPESMELLRVLPGDVNAELIRKLIIH